MLNAQGYMNAKRSKSGQEDMTNNKLGSGWIEDYNSLSFFRPFFRTVEGHDHTMFVMDIDVKTDEETEFLHTPEEVRDIKVRAALEQFNDPKWRDEFLMYISGQGLYLVQKYDKIIHKQSFEPIIFGEDYSLFNSCDVTGKHKVSMSCTGFHQETNDLVKKRMVQGNLVEVRIDKRMFNHEGGRLFRGVYSPYFKIKGFISYCIPVVWDGDAIDFEATIEGSKRHNFTEPQPVYVPPFSFEELLDDDVLSQADSVGILAHSKRIEVDPSKLRYKIDVPLPTDELSQVQIGTINEIQRLITSDHFITPPCVKNSYEQKYDRFWSRVVLVRYLANKGFTPDDIATFIRFRLNDAEDNKPKNFEKMYKGMKMAYGEIGNPHPMTSCMKLQNPKHQHFSCTPEDATICKRTYPMQDYPHTFEVKTKVEEAGGIDKWIKEEDNVMQEEDRRENKTAFELINDHAKKILSTDTNHEIIKTTRAGVTTSLIYNVALTHKKMLVVSPLNRIGEETFPQALKLAHMVYGIDINGALLSANTKSCLKLRFEIKDLEHRKRDEPDWGDYGVKYKDLAFHFKPSCIAQKEDGGYIECQYFKNRFPQPNISDANIPLPVIQSEITEYDYDEGVAEGMCAYTSVVQELDYYDVLFITYDKLNSLLMNTNSDDAELIVQTLLSDYDVIFMDEISQLAQQSPLSFQVYTRDRDGVTYETFFEELFSDLGKLLLTSPTSTAEFMYQYIEKFGNIFENEIDKLFLENYEESSFSIRYDNPLDDEDQEKFDELFPAFYSLLTNYTKKHNIHLATLEKVLILLKSDFWWIDNVPTNDYTINASMIASPKLINIRNFVKEFEQQKGKQVLVTDATMPLIKMSDLLGIDFERYVVGDPRNTCDYQLVISDTKNISSRHLLSGTFSAHFNRLLLFLNELAKLHDPTDMLVILPNSGKIFRHMKDAIREKLIPKMQLSYFRSDITVGTSSDKRIMVTVCPPYPPQGSYQWLAQYYHEWGLFSEHTIDELSAMLEKMNAFQTFYQTIGRVKSPDNSVRSIVYTWGINSKTTKELLSMDKDVPLPHLTTVEHHGADIKFIPVLGSFWRKFGLILNPRVIRILEFVKTQQNKFKIRTLINKLYKSLNKTKKEQIEDDIKALDFKILKSYGINSETDGNDNIFIYST
jgi:hypothetical protein